MRLTKTRGRLKAIGGGDRIVTVNIRSGNNSD